MPTSSGVVVAGGLVAGDQSTASSYRLDLKSGLVTRLPDLPVPVHDVGGAVVNGRPEVIGGGNATEQDVVQSWHTGGWRVSGRLPVPRSDLTAVSVGERVFVVGGYDGVAPAQADILVSTNGGGFRVFGRLRLAVRYAAVAVLDGAIWVFGGERSGVEVDAVQRIDLGTGRVQIVGHLTRGLGHASAVSWQSRILVIGGRRNDGTISAALWWFDPSTSSTLLRAGALPTPLADSAVVSIGPAVYLVGGENPTPSSLVLRLTIP